MLSLILPTYNESANITALIDVLDAVLQRMPHEIIVVDDDSPDGTWRVAESLTRKHQSVRVLRRIGRRGLSSAVVEGFDMAKGDMLAVMDADGQHDSELLLTLVSALEKGSDMAIGSRYVKGGSVGDWVTDRRIISGAGTLLAHKLSRVQVSDPLGGFFALKKKLYTRVRQQLRPSGFKILLEILASVPSSTKVTEVPLIFRMRLHGASKLSFRVQMEFLWQVLRLSFVRFTAGISTFCSAVFWIAFVAIAALLLPRAWNMRGLVQPALRDQSEQMIRELVDRHGWLLSDVRIVKFTHDEIILRHQQHLRIPSLPTVCHLTFVSPVSSCDPSEQ